MEFLRGLSPEDIAYLFAKRVVDGIFEEVTTRRYYLFIR